MAKDIDLSSKEWTDIVFEGRNKEYGAYYLRSTSDRRHNRALILTLIGAAVIAGLVIAWSAYSSYRQQKEEEEAALLAALEQQQFTEVEIELPEEEEEENQMQQEEIEIPEALPEEILNTEKFTEFLIVDNEQEIEQVKSNEEIQQTETAIGNVDFDKGTDDLNVDRTYKEEVIVEEKTPVKEEIFVSVEQMPQFPGGDAELLKWIASHIKYPTMAMENGVQGRVVVRFVVTKDGSIGEVQVARGKDPDLDKEAVRVVRSLPKFTPGRMNGQPVSVWYTLPVNFKLQGM